MPDTLYAIDVFSLVFQVFHAIPPMTGPAGQPTNAVFGFARDLLQILRTRRPDYLVCAMDTPGRGIREDLYPDYKANRTEMPEDLQPQIPVILELIEAFGIPAIGCEGWEADDVLATLARRGERDGVEVSIVTSDKDARQLLSPLVRLYNVRKDAFLDEAALHAEWGIRPDQVVDFQALVGDPVDNVPGVPGVGPKKAAALLAQFGTLDNILARAGEAPGKKLQESLKTFAEQARVSRELVRLNTDLDFPFDWNSARAGRLDVPRLVELFRECGFRRLIDEVRELESSDAIERPAGLFADGQPDVTVVTETAELETVLARLSSASAETQAGERSTPQPGAPQPVTLRLELTGLDPLRSSIAAVTLAGSDAEAVFIPLSELTGGPAGGSSTGRPGSGGTALWKCLAGWLTSGTVLLAGHDLKATLLALRRAGVESVPVGLDTMVGSYLLEAGSRSHSLSHLVDRYLGQPLPPVSTMAGHDPEQPGRLAVRDLARHGAEEACLSLRVAGRMQPELVEQELWPLYEDLERPLIPVLAAMEFTGVRVDPDELARQSADVLERSRKLVEEIHAQAGEEFNIDSPKQLAVVLFEKLQLPVLKKTKTGASTDQEVLEQLAQIHPLPEKIIEHRHLVKLRGTYLEALPKLIHPETGRIHASFNQVVAATGRLSTSNPNLQNIPIRTPDGERIRRAFLPGEPGWKLVCADYSQIELRMLAHFCGDVALCRAFEEGVDIHRAVAAQVFGVPPGEVTSEQRRMAKAVNFGVIYGQSPFGLSQALGITREAAAEFISDYFDQYSGVAEFLSRTLDETFRTGFARTILGRRRAIRGIRADRHGQLNMPERTAVNTVIQGSAADLIKRAMINLHRRLTAERHPARMLLQIHDELMFETPGELVEPLIDLVRHEMEHALELRVPVTVDIASGDNWLDARS